MVQRILNVIWQNEIFHVTIVILLIFGVVFELLSTLRYWWFPSRQIKRHRDAIDQLKREATNLNQKRSHRFQRSKHIGWFKEHLAEDLSGQNNVDGNTDFRAKVEGGRFVLIQYPAILLQSVPPSYLRFLPGILIAIGVLGTFYGIQAGLQDITLKSIGEDSSELLNASIGLLDNMKTAFSSSLMGLSASSVLTILLAGFTYIRQRQINSLRDQLEQVTFFESPERLLAHIASNSSQEAAQTLTQAANTIQTGFAELIEVQRQLKPEAIGREVGAVMHPVFEEIRNELQALREIKAESGQDILRSLMEEQREQLIQPIINELHRSSQLTQETSQSVRDLKEELSGISRSLADSIGTIQRFQEETLGELQNFANQLQSILSQFRDETQGAMQQVSTEFKEIRENLKSELQQALKNVREDYQAELKEFFVEQNNLLESTLGEQRQGLLQVVQELQNVFNVEYSRRQQLTEELEQNLTKIQETTQVVSRLANTIGLSSGERLKQLQELTGSLGGEAQRVEQVYENMVAQLNQALESSNQHLVTYLERSRESQMQFFTEADRATSKIANQLLMAANHLVAAERSSQSQR